MNTIFVLVDDKDYGVILDALDDLEEVHPTKAIENYQWQCKTLFGIELQSKEDMTLFLLRIIDTNSEVLKCDYIPINWRNMIFDYSTFSIWNGYIYFRERVESKIIDVV